MHHLSVSTKPFLANNIYENASIYQQFINLYFEAISVDRILPLATYYTS